MRTHFVIEEGLQEVPWTQGNDPFEGDEALQNVYEANSPIILAQHRPGPVMTDYNYPIGNDVTLRDLMAMAGIIYQDQQHSFKVNMSVGVILKHKETGEYRYFKPMYSSPVFDEPILVSKLADLQRLQNKINEIDLMQELLRQRPDTKWNPHLLCNVKFHIFHLKYAI